MSGLSLAIGALVGLVFGGLFGLPGLFFGPLIGMAFAAIVWEEPPDESQRAAEPEQRVSEREKESENERDC